MLFMSKQEILELLKYLIQSLKGDTSDPRFRSDWIAKQQLLTKALKNTSSEDMAWLEQKHSEFLKTILK
jgi:hypothetical protein